MEEKSDGICGLGTEKNPYPAHSSVDSFFN
jgi:hypothetical protein